MFVRCVGFRGTRDYGICDDEFESSLVLTLRCFVDIVDIVDIAVLAGELVDSESANAPLALRLAGRFKTSGCG